MIWNFGSVDLLDQIDPDGLSPNFLQNAPSCADSTVSDENGFEPDDLYEITVSESEMHEPSELTTKPFIRLTVDWM